MNLKSLKLAPTLLAVAVLALVVGIRLHHFDFLEQIERKTFDLRARTALHFNAPTATNLAFVSISDESIRAVKGGKLGYSYGLFWPRQVYGRLVEELNVQGTKAVAFDVLFGELRPDHPPVQIADGNTMESDDFFALQMHLAGNVILAATPGIYPPALFATNAYAVGHIGAEKDSDGILREEKAFITVRRWHSLFRQMEGIPELGVDLSRAIILPGKIILPQTGTTNSITVPVDAQNTFSLKDFVGDKLPAGVAPRAKAFTEERVWSLGIELAARELKLDLAQADVDLPHDRITLRGANDVKRVIPVDADGRFFVDWRIRNGDAHLQSLPIESLLWQDKERLSGETKGLVNSLQGKLVVVGSSAEGNDLTDRGATPLENDTLLASTHWNVANSVITGHFIRRAGLGVELFLILLLGAGTAFITWRFRSGWASLATILLVLVYIFLAYFVYVEFRWWLPLVFPVGGAILLVHLVLMTYRVVFEQGERRRVRSVFSKVIAPEVVNELLRMEKLSQLSGARREVSILFADIRGFTSMTDEMQQGVLEYVQEHHLESAAAEAYIDECAKETLATVNLYLGIVADAVKKHGGTLDKYIGDCVMAFWGAPVANEKHALGCVQAAIEAQRAIYALNDKRQEENPKIELENRARLSAGLPPLPLKVSLQLGTGVNTGLVTVGLMGSDNHILNYTVFGREVNLASRLESVSGSGRVIISDTTYNHLLRHGPELASTCVEMFPVTVKGIRNAVRIYEMPWQEKAKI